MENFNFKDYLLIHGKGKINDWNRLINLGTTRCWNFNHIGKMNVAAEINFTLPSSAVAFK